MYVHLIFISIEIIIFISGWVYFSTWNEYLEIKRTGYRFCEVTLNDKSHRAVWLSNRTVTDLSQMAQQELVQMVFTSGDSVRIPRDEIISIREIKKPTEIVRKL